MPDFLNPKGTAQKILNEINSVSVKNVPSLRKIRKEYSRKLKKVPAEKMLDLARELIRISGFRWIAFELLRNHPEAL